MCNAMARGHVWPLAKNAKLHSINSNNRLLSKLIVCCSCSFLPLVSLQIRYLLKCFKPWNLLTFSFGILTMIQYKTNVKKEAKGQVGTEIDLQETKAEQSQRLWRTETNVQNSIKR